LSNDDEEEDLELGQLREMLAKQTNDSEFDSTEDDLSGDGIEGLVNMPTRPTQTKP
jgi:hypothetical protein